MKIFRLECVSPLDDVGRIRAILAYADTEPEARNLAACGAPAAARTAWLDPRRTTCTIASSAGLSTLLKLAS